MKKECQVLVTGAGPTGLVMASELARRGIACRIIDIARGPTDKSKAIGIQARTLEVFENMGLAKEIISQGHPAQGVNIYENGERIVHLSFQELDSPFPYILLCPQSETERILLAHLESLGVSVEREVKLTGFTQDAEGVTAALSHPNGQEETLRVPWLIGCDGPHSTVRHTLGLPFTGIDYEDSFQLADVKVDWSLPDTELHIIVHEGWLLAVFPLPDGRCRLIVDVPPEQAPLDKTPTLAEIQARVDERSHVKAVLSDPLWTANYRIHRRMVSRLREGRAFLLGDAAHIHSPAGAQGMNTGIQDAFNLAWKLALTVEGRAGEALLATYQTERDPVEQGVLHGTDLLLKIVTTRNPIAQATRDTLAPLLSGLEVVQQRIRRTISELAVEYRPSLIVEEHSLGAGPSAGERAPDAAVVQPGQGQTRLYEIMQRKSWTLLLFGGSSSEENSSEENWRQLAEASRAAQEAAGDFLDTYFVTPSEGLPLEAAAPTALLRDKDLSLHNAYGADKPCLYLIRPDGYIGFRASVHEADRLPVFLSRIFEARP
jgi:2-polyprenyl-6-methoxyphenol hydroxylase-like FAD-dependent oxidoreductase